MWARATLGVTAAILAAGIVTNALSQSPVFCPTRPVGDNTNACASTAFVMANGGGAGGSVSSVANSDGTLTISPTTGNVVASIALGHANTWTGEQAFNSGKFFLNGSSSGRLGLVPASASGASTITFPLGTTDFTSTGGTGKFVKQATASGALTVAAPIISEISGMGTAVASALGANVGSAGAIVVNGGALGTPSSGTLTSATGLPILTGVSGLGTSVATALGVSIGTTGSVARYIASGSRALATAAISSATCATVVTATATGVLSTDAVSASFNGDPTAVTGYVPLTTGMLTIIVYPSADLVNFKVCNNTAASITPGAITLNWMVSR